jgi:hypothetical protein
MDLPERVALVIAAGVVHVCSRICVGLAGALAR